MVPLGASDRPAGSEPPVVDQVFPPVPPLAESVWLYAAPTVPAGSDDVVMVNGGGATVMLSDCVAVAFELSFTCTVKFAGPAVVGVPLMVPLAASNRPEGSEPRVVDHVYPPIPPLAESVWLYAAPTVPAGSDVVLILSGTALRLRLTNPAIKRQTLDASIMGAPPAKRTGAERWQRRPKSTAANRFQAPNQRPQLFHGWIARHSRIPQSKYPAIQLESPYVV